MAKTKNDSSRLNKVLQVEDESPRVVTPTDPLNITTTPVSFEQVWIEGGDINVTVETAVTFAQLKKIS